MSLAVEGQSTNCWTLENSLLRFLNSEFFLLPPSLLSIFFLALSFKQQIFIKHLLWTSR